MNIFKTINVKECNTFFSKLIGFSFKKNIIDYAYKFKNVNSIQTIFMFQNIDIIMTDKKYNVLYLFNNIKPFNVILPKKNVYFTFELPINFINKYKIKIGDNINE